LVLVAVLAALVGSLPGSVAAAAPDPVVLVHGYRGSPGTWADMKRYLEAQGRTVVAIDLPGQDNVVNARAIRDLVAARRWKNVDLVGQSMGGLSARHFVKFLVSNGVMVRSYVSLGTPHYGITAACFLPSSYGGQMCPSSGFLSRLNNGDDTPGETVWTTIFSTADEYVPPSATRLDGGACHVQFEGVRHNDMDNHAGIMAATATGLDGGCAASVQKVAATAGDRPPRTRIGAGAVPDM
jgi:triacylglycerol lipase